MLRIIRIIIDGYHGTGLVEILHQHPLFIEIENAHRTLNRIHSPFFPPLLYRTKQSRGYFPVIYKLNKAKTDIARMPLLIGTVIDNAGNSAHDTPLRIVCNKRLDV